MKFTYPPKIKLWVPIAILGGVLCGSLAGLLIGLTHDLPQIRSLESFTPSAETRIFTRDGVLLSELFIEKRVPVPLDKIPEELKSALIATEDRKFYRHSGVDLKAVVRAIVKDILAGEFVEGASTITQQLAKTLFLTPRKTLVRKLKEAVLAFQLERRYTKDEILSFYLNQVYFGSGAYGVEAAARIFFGKSVSDLTLAECALVAGMPKLPTRYSPLVNPDLAVKRRNLVLRQMAAIGIITAEELDAATSEPLMLAPPATGGALAPYFVEYLKNELEEIIGPAILYKGGLTVRTTLSHNYQQQAESAVNKGLEALTQRMPKVDTGAAPLQGALVSIDVSSGGIVAMVGGSDFDKSPYNRAVSARRQPGSAFKPIIYAFAIEQGIPQNQLILDAPVAFRGALKGEDWQPENFSETYQGEMTLRRALTLSKNIPTVRLLERLGPEPVAEFARALGLSSSLQPNLTLALGTSEVSLLELTAAYAVFANRGEAIEPWAIAEIIDHRGREIWRHKARKQIVMSRAGAAVVTNMLVGVVKEGTGRGANKLKRVVAGKTGTTDLFKDALFVGFSPSTATGVWVGRDDATPIGDKQTGAAAALPIWIDYMEGILSDRQYEFFDVPDDVVQVTIDPISGERLGQGSPRGVAALFKKGSEPP